jgi:hypothetical protein
LRTAYSRKNKAFTMTHTIAAGQATFSVSLQLLATTPFLDFHVQRKKPLTASNEAVAPALPRRDVPGTGSESTKTPKTDFSFALAAEAQSAAEMSVRGIVTRRETPVGRCVKLEPGAGDTDPEAGGFKLVELARRRPMLLPVEGVLWPKPRPWPGGSDPGGTGRKYEGGSTGSERGVWYTGASPWPLLLPPFM